MKGIRLDPARGLNGIAIAELPDPGQPRAGEVRVRIHASSLNFHDYIVANNNDQKFAGRIPLSDGGGVVEAVGDGVTEFKVGDAVVSCFFPEWLDGAPTTADFLTVPGDGVDGYAQPVVVRPTAYFTHAPRGYSHAEAATLTTAGLTAWRALIVDGGLKAGDSVLVLGTGGVSIFALQIAKAMGATVIATSSKDEKLKRLSALGADHTINYKTDPAWGTTVQTLTGGRGVDHVIEVGGPGTLAQSITAVRNGGHISLIGVLTGFGGEVPTAAMMVKQVKLQGIVVGNRRHQQDFVRAIDATGLRPVIDRSFKLAELAAAFRHEESGAHFGKICVEIGD